MPAPVERCAALSARGLCESGRFFLERGTPFHTPDALAIEACPCWRQVMAPITFGAYALSFIGEARFRCWMYTGLPILPIWLASSLLVAYYHRLSSPDGASPTPRGFSTFQAMYHGICMMSGTLIWLVGSLCWRRPTDYL